MKYKGGRDHFKVRQIGGQMGSSFYFMDEKKLVLSFLNSYLWLQIGLTDLIEPVQDHSAEFWQKSF